MSDADPARLLVLISGNGSNLQAILDACANGEIPARVVAVISNRPAAPGLQRADAAGAATAVLDHTAFPDRETFDAALAELIDGYRPDLVILAGFMRILTPAFVRHYRGRMLNIHPSLLPEFQGLHTHRRVLEADRTEHGASVHFVTEQLDGGPVVLQGRVPVEADDDADSLAARVLRQEHRIYPAVVKWFVEGRLRMDDTGSVMLDGKALTQPLRWDD